MALRLTARTADAYALVASLELIRGTAPNHDGNGMVATPWPGGAGTGFGSDTYPNRLHVASTAWTGLAILVAGGAWSANPLRPLAHPCAPYDGNGDGRVNALDISGFSGAYGTTRGQDRYREPFDGNHDGRINALDISGFSGCYGQSW